MARYSVILNKYLINESFMQIEQHLQMTSKCIFHTIWNKEKKIRCDEKIGQRLVLCHDAGAKANGYIKRKE